MDLKSMIAASLVCAPFAVSAQTLPEGPFSVFLQAEDGARTKVAVIEFTVLSDQVSTYQMTLIEAAFADHFLSMRPFNCLEGTDKHWCHVPYPYPNQRQISASDLTDLEYDLLFLWKGATDYGINMWNGVYYDLSLEARRITGQMAEINMDVLSAPPAPGDLRPIGPGDLHQTDSDGHWLPRLVIE